MVLRTSRETRPSWKGDHTMHAITPDVLVEVLIGAGCIALFAYCAFVFASVGRRVKRARRSSSLPNEPR